MERAQAKVDQSTKVAAANFSKAQRFKEPEKDDK